MSNQYILPPFCLIAPVLRFLVYFRLPFTIVVSERTPRRFWWPVLLGASSEVICLCSEGDPDVLLCHAPAISSC